MKTNFINRLVLPVFVVALAFAVGSCSKEDLRDSNAHMSERSNLERAYVDDLAALNNSGGQGPGNAAQNRLLAQIRQATVKYQDFAVAEADGYMLNPGCVSHPELGGMGFHAVNFGLIVDTEVDPLRPEVLVYEAQEDGTLKLVAVEFLVPAHNIYVDGVGVLPFPSFWDYENDGPPMLGNKEFDDHRDFANMGGPGFPHYQLHVWLWKGNPSGIYAPFNPNVSCDYADLIDFPVMTE